MEEIQPKTEESTATEDASGSESLSGSPKAKGKSGNKRGRPSKTQIEEAYQRGRQEAWEDVRKFLLNRMRFGDLGLDDWRDVKVMGHSLGFQVDTEATWW